ncbi:hypothetical protein ACJX0J_030831 [Zea mays]
MTTLRGDDVLNHMLKASCLAHKKRPSEEEEFMAIDWGKQEEKTTLSSIYLIDMIWGLLYSTRKQVLYRGQDRNLLGNVITFLDDASIQEKIATVGKFSQAHVLIEYEIWFVTALTAFSVSIDYDYLHPKIALYAF